MGSQSTAKYSTLDVDVLDPAAASWAPSKFDGVHTQNRYSWRTWTGTDRDKMVAGA